MDATNQYFTHTIVGAPMTAFLGRRSKLAKFSAAGIEVNLRDGKSRLSGAWEEWMLVRAIDELDGRPRMRPGTARRWIERHCLLIGALGIALSAFAVGWTFAFR